MTKKMKHLNMIVPQAISALLKFLNKSPERTIEPVRVARAGWAIIFAGCETSTPIFKDITKYLIQAQRDDGGWSDSEETAWCASFIARMHEEDDSNVTSAVEWLISTRHKGGGWGRHYRDQARIPVTAIVSALLPTTIEKADFVFLSETWRKDLADTVQLSYKAGFHLLAEADNKHADVVLLEKTVAYLAQEQNEDGGFGPWRNHPMGSDPWSTGVVLWGLSQWIQMVNPEILIKALDWLEKTQLPSGHWPYHYLDDGTSIALIGTVSALKNLKG